MAACVVGSASAVVIDEWGFDSSGTPEVSNNGTSLQSSYQVSRQQSWAVQEAGFLTLSNTNGQFFTGKRPLATSVDLTSSASSVVRMTINYAGISVNDGNLATDATWGFRLADVDSDNYISIQIGQDTSDKIWARTKSEVGGVSQRAGRLANGQEDLTGAYDVVLELDYANNEIRTYSPGGWQFDANGTDYVFTNAYNFADNSIDSIDYIQGFQQNVEQTGTQGAFIKLDNLRVEAIPEPATLGIVAISGLSMLFIRRRFMM